MKQKITPDRLIETLEQYLNESKRLKEEGENEYQDWGSLLLGIEEFVRFTEVSLDL